MNEDDLRDCFAMFAMLGLTTKNGINENYETRAGEAYKIADTMLEARKKKEVVEDGIVAIKPKRRSKSE